MRDPRAGLGWSRHRAQTRTRYERWMASDAWRARRRAWLAAYVARTGIAPCCAVCDRPWTLTDGQLHHRSYRHLGAEADTDLVQLCAACHQHLHRILESHPGWLRQAGRSHATDVIIARLRAAGASHRPEEQP